METITLMGAESVRTAGATIRNAANEMRNVADCIQVTLANHELFLNDWLNRFEAVLNACLPKSNT